MAILPSHFTVHTATLPSHFTVHTAPRSRWRRKPCTGRPPFSPTSLALPDSINGFHAFFLLFTAPRRTAVYAGKGGHAPYCRPRRHGKGHTPHCRPHRQEGHAPHCRSTQTWKEHMPHCRPHRQEGHAPHCRPHRQEGHAPRCPCAFHAWMSTDGGRAFAPWVSAFPAACPRGQKCAHPVLPVSRRAILTGAGAPHHRSAFLPPPAARSLFITRPSKSEAGLERRSPLQTRVSVSAVLFHAAYRAPRSRSARSMARTFSSGVAVGSSHPGMNRAR